MHGDTNIIADMAKRLGWELVPAFSWAQGDGGPSEKEAPDGGAGYYYFGDTKRYIYSTKSPCREPMLLHAVFWTIGAVRVVETKLNVVPTGFVPTQTRPLRSHAGRDERDAQPAVGSQ